MTPGLAVRRSPCCVVVGLTDRPDARRQERGSPGDWQVYGPFHSEAAARRWERMMESLPGYTGAGPDRGWRYGFTYTAQPHAPGRPWPR